MPADLLSDVIAQVVTGLGAITSGATYHYTPGTVREGLKVPSLTIEARPVYAVSLVDYDVVQQGGGFHQGTGQLEIAIVMDGDLDAQEPMLRKAARDILRWFTANEKLGGTCINAAARARFELDREPSDARTLMTGSVFVDFVHRFDHSTL